LASEVTQASVFIVAQRVSTVMNADNILVLDEGRLVGQGTHRELMQSCGTYREIVESQLSVEELA
jgi:ATP-binding cassette subfamily B protein